jgi:ABC-2 type transport system permease protein
MNGKRLLSISRKEVLHIKRDIQSLIIVLIAPVILLILYGYGVTFDVKEIHLGVADRDKSRDSRELIRKFSASGYFIIHPLSDTEAGVKTLRRGAVIMTLTVPEDFSSDITRSRKARIQIIADGTDSNTAGVALGYAKKIVADYSSEIALEALNKTGTNGFSLQKVEPVPRVWYNAELESQNFIVPGLIAILMMLVAATLTSLTVVREKERGTFEQVISTPVKPMELMAGKLLPYIVIGLVDVGIVVAAGLGWFGVPFRGSVLLVLLFSVLFLFCSLGLGLFISSVASTQTTAVMVTVFATMLPSVLLSGFVFPISSMPLLIRLVTYLVPAKYFLTALRSLFLKSGVGLSVLYPEALFLALFGSLFLFLSAKKFRKVLKA